MPARHVQDRDGRLNVVYMNRHTAIEHLCWRSRIKNRKRGTLCRALLLFTTPLAPADAAGKIVDFAEGKRMAQGPDPPPPPTGTAAARFWRAFWTWVNCS